MPTFEIPDGPTTVKLGGDIADPKSVRTGGVVFSVTNKSGEARAGRLGVQVNGGAKAEWFTLEGEREREFAAGETQTASIKIGVPPDAPPGDYPFRLRVVAVNDPDNDHADGPVTTARVDPPIGGKPGVPAWVWVLVALAVLAAVGVGAYLLLRPKEKPVVVPTPTPTPVPTEAGVAVPDLAGKTLDEAKALSQGLDLTPVAGLPAGKPPNTILSQSPPAGQRLNSGFPIKVTYDPGVEVPSLTGMTTDRAVNTLGPLGLRVASSTVRCETSGVAGRIVDQKPQPGERVASATGVDVFVRTLGAVSGVTGLGRFRITCGVRYRGVLSPTVRPRVLIARPAGGG